MKDFFADMFGPNAQGKTNAFGSNPDTLSLVGLLRLQGVPEKDAYVQAATLNRQREQDALERNLYELKKQELLGKQQQAQAGEDMFSQLMGGMGDFPMDPTASSTMPSMDPMAPMGAPSAPSAPRAPSLPLAGGLTPEDKNTATLMWKSGDKKGAIKFLQDAKEAAAAKTFANGFVKDPMMGSAKGGAGSTYVNPQTGEAVSSNTGAMATTDQTTVAAVDRVIPQLQEMLQILPQFQSATKQVETWFDEMGNKYLGSNNPLPSEQAKGEALINNAAEGLMKAFNLPNNAESLNMVKTSIAPKDGESGKAYKTRLEHEIQNLKRVQAQAKKRLSSGTVVQSATPTYTLEEALAERARRRGGQ